MGKCIEIENLSLGYKDGRKEKLEIFPPFSIIANYGESIALVGRNGVGKSTFLRTIGGLQNIFSGKIFINNNDISKLSRKKFAENVSFVSTESVKVMNLRVFDLVSFGRYTYTGWLGNISEFEKKIVVESLEMVGMLDFIRRNISELSDGERQRVMIARALAQDTPIIILDEPTAFLDIPNKYGIIQLLTRLAKEKSKTVIFSTHDLNIALQLSTKIWFMSEGKMYSDAPQNMIKSGIFSQMLKNANIEFSENVIKFFI